MLLYHWGWEPQPQKAIWASQSLCFWTVNPEILTFAMYLVLSICFLVLSFVIVFLPPRVGGEYLYSLFILTLDLALGI